MVMATAIADAGSGTAAGDQSRRPARLCSAVALVSIAAHLWMAWEHRAMPWESALMVVMAAVCLPCAVAVWRHAHDKAVQLLMVMALLMVAVHAALLLAPGAMAASHGSMGSMTMPVHGDGNQMDAMLGIIALELVVALMAAWVVRRSRTHGAAAVGCAMGLQASSSGEFTAPGA